MRSTLEPVDPTKVRISVVVEPDELRPAIDRTARRLSREVRVPGFRKGKVPRQVIEARIDREALLAEAIEQEAVPEFYAKAIEELGVQPLSRAQVEPPDYTDGEALEFSATFEVKPELDLPPYRGVEVERPVLEVTDEHIDAQLERLRDRVAQLEVIGRPLAKDDFAQIDLRATHHTDEIPELTRSDFLYEVGSGTVVPKLDEELEGKRKGDILQFNATLPEEAGEELAGREVTFQVLVKEAKAKVLPKLDDDFAQEASEFDTLDELKADLRQRLEGAAAAQTASELEARVLQAYLDQVEVPLPESLVHDELHYRANRFAQQLQMMGTNLEQYLTALEQTAEDVEADLRAQAERAVKAQLVLEAVAAAEGFEASVEEVEAEIRRQAQRVGRDPEEVRRALADGRVGVITGDILRSKALAFMVEHAEQRDPAPDDESEPKE
ncbi:MAG TPA: trigger factor [Actinomycetes bacterium]|nr:trigger factor [Actinomycetes bacterium]